MKRELLKICSLVLSKVSYKNLCRVMYYAAYKRLPNLKHPKLLSEKIMWSAIYQYQKDPLVAQCADKVAVREYISHKGYSSILNEIYGIWDDASKINWEALPKKFVIKCNHASGLNLVCVDKSTLNYQMAEETLNKWLKVNYWKQSGEIFYKNIDRKLICEKFIETADKKPPKDYKFFCSNGKVKFLYVALNRVNNNTNFNFFTPEWEPIPVTDVAHPQYSGMIPKPNNLDEMIKIAEDISRPWGQVRVDFYDENDEIIFGELTFMHHGGKPQFEPKKYDEIFGSMIDLE